VIPAGHVRSVGIAVAGGLAAVAGAVTLRVFDPVLYGFYPRCPLFVLTGLFCPGCGALRAAHLLLHGDLPGALSFNPLLVISLPLLAWWAVRAVRPVLAGGTVTAPPLSGRASRALAAGVIAYAVLRNVPVAPFTLLAP
jgi:hypothetical protein